MHDLIKQSRIYISTYNATTYLESLALNIPTIMYWNPTYWELRNDAIPYFELLKSAKIFYETPESAAKHMVDVWDDVSAWRQSDTVQTNRRLFSERYSHTPEKPVDKLETVFR